MTELTVTNGSRVILNFALHLEDGREIDNNFDADPVELLVGNGDMFASFEASLLGLKAGEQVEQVIPCEQAFGRSQEENRQRFARRLFDNDIELAPGLVVSFADKANAELPGVVVELSDEYVLVDFNHPLADENIVFKARISEVLS